MRRLFLLGLMLVWVGGIAVAQDVLTLTKGDPLTINIAGTETISAVYEGAAEEQVYLTLMGAAGGIDARISVLAPNGAIVAQNVHLGDREFVLPFILLETGRYTVAVQRQDFSDFTGDALLLLDTITIPSVQLNETQTGTLVPPLGLTAYTFEAESDTLAGYKLDCTGECTLFIVSDDPATGEVIPAGYYSERLFQPILNLATGGTYHLYIQNVNASTDYTLNLYQYDPPVLNVNEPATGTIESDQALIFAFDSAAGKVWQINGGFGADGDRGIEVYNFERTAGDVIVARDYGTGPEGNPRISQFAAPEDGRYYIALYWRTYQDLPTTDYTLNLSPDTLKQLAPGTTFTGEITPESGQENYLYTGKAGETLRLTLERTSETGSISLRVLSEADEVVVYYERGATRAQFDITLPIDGRYQFNLSDISYTPGVLGYAITMEKVEE